MRLTDVFIDDQLTVPANNDGGALDLLQTIGFVWFELLITSCYLGAATALAERVFQRRRTPPTVLSELSVRLETATLLLERIAMHLQHEAVDHRSLVGHFTPGTALRTPSVMPRLCRWKPLAESALSRRRTPHTSPVSASARPFIRPHGYRWPTRWPVRPSANRCAWTR